MPSSEESGSSSPRLDVSIIHDLRPGLFAPPRYSIPPPRPRRIKSWRSIRQDGREYTKAEQQYFLLELHQRLLRVLAEQYATGEVEPPPRYIQLVRTPFNWSHYLNIPDDEGSEGMDLDEMDKKAAEKLLQMEVKALLELYDTDPNRFFDTIIEMNEAAREQTEEVRPIERPSAQMIEMIRNNTAAGLDPSRVTRTTTSTAANTSHKRAFFSMLEILNLNHRPPHLNPTGLLHRIALWRSSSAGLTGSALKNGADPLPRKPAGEGNQLGPTAKSRLLPDPKPWIPFGKPTAGDRPIGQATETHPVRDLRTDLFDPNSKRTEFTNEENQALNADINRIRVIMAARRELELGRKTEGDPNPEASRRLGMELDAPALEGAWTERRRDQYQDWRMQIINQLCESGSTSSELPTKGDRNDHRSSIGTRMPYCPYQMNPARENGDIEAWRARRDDFGSIGMERAAKRSRAASPPRRY